MDIRRVPFIQDAQPFTNSDQVVKIIWYPARVDAKTLPFPSLLAVGDWDDRGWYWLPGGEVLDSPRPYSNQKPRVAAKGDHQCGTREMFAEGCELNYSLPPVIYTSNDLPRCCNVPIVGIINDLGAPDGTVRVTNPHSGVIEGREGVDSQVVVYPPGGTPGTDCLTAPKGALASTQCGVSSPGAELWFSWSPVAPGPYTITLTGLTDADVMLGAKTGSCPAGLLTEPLAHVSGFQTWQGFHFGGSTVWVVVTGTLGAGAFCLTLTQP